MAFCNAEFFLGATGENGFVNRFADVYNNENDWRVYIIKGGAGCGKSTFMKRIAKKLVSLGCETELLHCSSDPDSLDGVCAREVGFLILDGTSPHVVDPKCPGAVDEIINLGEC